MIIRIILIICPEKCTKVTANCIVYYTLLCVCVFTYILAHVFV